MRMLLIIATFCVSSLSISSELDEVISVIGIINQGSIIKPLDLQCTGTLVEPEIILHKSNSSLFNKCAIDLCGPVEKNKSVWITDSSNTPSASWFLKRKINNQKDTFDKIFDTALRLKNNELNSIKQNLKTIDKQIENLN